MVVKAPTVESAGWNNQHKFRDLEQPKPQVFHVVVVLRQKCKCKSLTDTDSINTGYNH